MFRALITPSILPSPIPKQLHSCFSHYSVNSFTIILTLFRYLLGGIQVKNLSFSQVKTFTQGIGTSPLHLDAVWQILYLLGHFFLFDIKTEMRNKRNLVNSLKPGACFIICFSNKAGTFYWHIYAPKVIMPTSSIFLLIFNCLSVFWWGSSKVTLYDHSGE